MKNAAFFICLLYCLSGCAGTNIESLKKSIENEGMALYRSEMASWVGTDLMMKKYPDNSRIGGYISYTEGETSKCVFYSKDERPKAIATFTFDSSYSPTTAIIELTDRDLTSLESQYAVLRDKTQELIMKDSLFKVYENTSLNIVPLISGNEKRSYVITGSSSMDYVMFGNDYVITFDKDNSVTGRKKLHNGLIPVKVEKDTGDRHFEGPMHTHLPEYSDLMTPTDICTTMLYGRFVGWSKGIVTSMKYISIWDCDTKTLKVTPMDKKEKDDQ